MTIRSPDESVAVENSLDVLKVDLVIAQISFALFWIPREIANVCEQPLHIFRHSNRSPAGSDAVCTVEVRYDGFEVLGKPPSWASLRPYLKKVYIQPYVLRQVGKRRIRPVYIPENITSCDISLAAPYIAIRLAPTRDSPHTQPHAFHAAISR
jgi:hypothetical protein